MRTKDENRFGVIIDFVNEYFESYGRSPSTREIESGTKISRPTVQRYQPKKNAIWLCPENDTMEPLKI